MITKPSVDKQDTQINYIAELNRFEFRPSHKANEFPPVLKDSTNSLPFSDSTDSRTYEVFHKLPLRELVVYVEIFSNGVNISETCYNYLQKLGAQVEKRMNKKCSLIIWKEGSMKTIEKAKENKVPVVNSLWLEDCMEKYHCAPFDKFSPKLPKETDVPFLAAQNNKKKRKTMDVMTPVTLAKFCGEDLDNPQKSSSTNHKRSKRSFDKDFGKENKIEIKLGCQKKLSEFFGAKANNSFVINENSKEYDEEKVKNSISSMMIHRSKTVTFQGEVKNESPEHKPNEQESQKVEEIKDHNTSRSISGQNSNSFSLENFLKNKDLEEKEANSITKVKNMILSYANVNNGESSTTGNNFPLLNNEGFSTSSTNRNQTKASSSSIDEFEYKEFQIFSNYSKQEEKKTKEKLTIKVTGPADIKNDIEKETSHTKQSVIEDKSSKKKVVSSQKSKKETKSVQKTRDSAVKNKEMETTTPKTPRGKSSAKSTRESAIFLHIPDRRVSQYSEFTEITETTGRKSRGKSLASDFKSSNKKKNSRIVSSSVDLQLSTSTLLAPPRPSTSKKVVTKKQSQPKSLGKNDNQKPSTDNLMGIENPGILKKRFISKKNEKAGRDFQDKEVLFSQELQTNDNKKTESDEMKLTSVIETLAKEAIEKTSRRKQSLVKNNLFDCKGINVSVDKSKQFTRVTVSKNLDEPPRTKDLTHSNQKGPRVIKTIHFINTYGDNLKSAREFCNKFDLQLHEDARNIEEYESLIYSGSHVPHDYVVALAMTKGKLILKKEWIDDSLKDNELRSYEDYKVKYHSGCKRGLFSKTRFFIDKEFEQLALDMIGKKELLNLIEQCGGSVLENVRACDFYITRKDDKKKLSLPPHVKVITPQWIVESIIEGKFLNTQHERKKEGDKFSFMDQVRIAFEKSITKLTDFLLELLIAKGLF